MVYIYGPFAACVKQRSFQG